MPNTPWMSPKSCCDGSLPPLEAKQLSPSPTLRRATVPPEPLPLTAVRSCQAFLPRMPGVRLAAFRQ